MSLPERLAESVLSNPRSDRVRTVAGLARRSARSKQGLFLAEGPQNVREALAAHLGRASGTTTGVPELDALYVTEGCLERHPDIADLVDLVLTGGDTATPATPSAEPAGRRVFIRMVTEDVLRAMSDAQSPQGAIAVCRIPVPTPAHTLGRARLTAVLCRVQDPGNAGTIIRAADAAGADAVVLTAGSVDLFNPKTVRSTAGSLFHLPVVTGMDFEDLVQAVGGSQLLAADGYAALDLDVLQDASATGADAPCDLSAPTAWLFGNEAQGLSEQEKAAAAHRVAVPLYGGAESLNVGTAATLCLYASARAQRRAASSS